MTKRELVLVIDDDCDFCSLVAIVLQKEGYRSQCAHTLSDSLNIMKLVRPHLVLLDNNLPDGKGLDFFVINKPLFHYSRVLMITADPSEKLQTVALLEGVEVFLSKPLMLKEFRKIICRPTL